MIKLRRLGQHNLEIRDEDDTHRGGFSGPVAIIDAFMLMQEQAQRYRADGLFAAAGLTELVKEKDTAYRWWTLAKTTTPLRNFEVAWLLEQKRNQQKREAHTSLQDRLTAEYVAARAAREPKPSTGSEPCIGDYVLPRTTVEKAPLDLLVSMWLSDQLSWKRYTEELKRRGFKPEEVAAAREEQEQEREQEKRELLGPELPTEDGERVAILNDIDGVISEKLQRIFRRILART